MNPIRRFVRSIRNTFAATAKRVKRRLYASYDAAQSSPETDDYWAWSDSLNANAANSPEVRKTLRERARYQRDNDGHLSGLVEKIARDLVGSGPRLQVMLSAWSDPDFGTQMEAAPGSAHKVELRFVEWCRRVGLARKLRVLHETRIIDGEAFALMITNPAAPENEPSLDIKLYEADQIDTPFYLGYDPLEFPGGLLDSAGNVATWHILKTHPGSYVWATDPYGYDAVPASLMVHWMKQRRPGQIRGIPEITPGLNLYAYIRRYTLAVLGSAETAAKIAGILEVDTPPPDDSGDDPPAIEAMDQVPIPRGALLTTYGKVSQLKAEQPTTQYQAFKAEVLTEAGAALGAPRNHATNSSAEYNYSSGRLDHLPYERMIAVIRGDLREVVLDRIFRAWLYEATRIPGYLPDDLPPLEAWSWEWHYDGFDSIDPLKDAKTDETNLRNGMTTLARVYARSGQDWEESMRQRAREIALGQQLETEMNLPPGSLTGLAPPTPEVVLDGTEQTAAA